MTPRAMAGSSNRESPVANLHRQSPASWGLLLVLAIAAPLAAQDRAWWDTLPAQPPVATSWSYASQYVPMRDGVRLAVDTYLPDGVARPLATIVEQTRYRRQLLFRDPARNARPTPPGSLAGFLRAGYAVVVVDVRGTGASFGHRTTEFSPAEVRDGWDVLDWIVAQPWSNGTVGATGVSYPGTTAELMGTLGHPALKAVAPRFSIYDLYADVVFPGGIFLEPFMRAWGGMVARMDANQFDAPGGPVIGVRPVNGPHGDSLLVLAIIEHARNADIFEQVQGLEARDDTAADGFTFDDVSPHGRYDTLSRQIPIYSWGGWADGFSISPITRYLDQPSPGSRLIMGPWNHGGAWSYYPGSPPVRSEFNHVGELLRFFDHHLRGMDSGIDDEPPIHYFTTGSNEWKAANEWPVATRKFLWTGGSHTEADTLWLAVNPTLGTGQQSRWNTILGGGAVAYRPRLASDTAGQLHLPLSLDPLPAGTTLTGTATLELTLHAPQPGRTIFAYLEEVDAHGTGHLITEGQLRLGDVTRIEIPLLPTSHEFAAGSRVRVVLTRRDVDHFRATAGSDLPIPIASYGLVVPLEP